jgi:biopolymer transport protein ExbB
MLFAHAPFVLATAGSPSFTGIFFWSRSAGGGIDWVGSGMIWLLIALSIVNVGLIVRLWLDHRRDAIATPGLAERLLPLVKAGRRREAAADAERDGSDLGVMIRAGLAATSAGESSALAELPDMLHAMQVASDEAFTVRVRTLERLNLLGQVSPMIGLFGTVYGMIVAFQTIAATGGAADPVLLAGGIGTALVTTFWGLLIAIPALAAYASLRSSIEATLADAEAACESLFRAVPAAAKSEPI